MTALESFTLLLAHERQIDEPGLRRDEAVHVLAHRAHIEVAVDASVRRLRWPIVRKALLVLKKRGDPKQSSIASGRWSLSRCHAS